MQPTLWGRPQGVRGLHLPPWQRCSGGKGKRFSRALQSKALHLQQEEAAAGWLWGPPPRPWRTSHVGCRLSCEAGVVGLCRASSLCCRWLLSQQGGGGPAVHEPPLPQQQLIPPVLQPQTASDRAWSCQQDTGEGGLQPSASGAQIPIQTRALLSPADRPEAGQAGQHPMLRPGVSGADPSSPHEAGAGMSLRLPVARGGPEA